MKKKITLCLVVAFLSLVAGAQNVKINTNQKSVPISFLISEIEGQTNYSFICDEGIVNLNDKLEIPVKSGSVEQILAASFCKGSGYAFKINGNNIAILPEPKPQAKTVNVSGKVVDNAGEPLIGAGIQVKGTGIGTIADVNGFWTLEGIPEQSVLVFSSIGFRSVEAFVSGRSTIDIKMVEDINFLDEVVVVGYGTQKKANLTGAVDAISGSQLENRSLSNVSEMIQGAMPNVTITFDSGEPGAGGNINVRGFTSINGGSPLVLIDGVPGDINAVNPKDIESISVLKDAASAAIYGARAAFGVVLVTTKTAKEGKFTVTYNDFFAFATPTTSTDFITTGYDALVLVDNAFSRTIGRTYSGYSAEDYQELLARRNDVVEDPSRPWVVVKNVDGRDIYNYYGNYDWWHTFFSDWQPSQSHNLSLSGGTEKLHFMLSGNFYTKDGILKVNPDKFNSFNLRSKVDAQMTPWLKVYNNTAFSSKSYRFTGVANGSEVFRQIVCHALPFYVPVNPDGTNVYDSSKNTYYVGDGYLAAIRAGAGGENKTYQLSTSTGMILNLYKDILTLNADYTYLTSIQDNYVRRQPITYSIEPGVVEEVSLPVFRIYNTMEQVSIFEPQHSANVFLSYNQTFNEKHSLSATVGLNYEHKSYKRLVGQRDGLTSDTLSDLSLGTENDKVKGGRHAYSLFGTFARINYNYDERYLVEFNGRYDGTSRFRKGKRFGFFPSISAAWRVSEESFFEPAKDIMSSLKIRASFGQLGNQQGSNYYPYISAMSGKLTSWIVNGEKSVAYSSPAAVSEDLTWETVQTTDVGIDMGFWDSRINLTGDFYIRDTKDMLVPGVVLPSVFGTASPQQNAGDLRTMGYELALSFNDERKVLGKPFSYGFNFSFGDSVSEITKFDNPTKSLTTYYEGMRIGEIWGYKVSLFQSDAEAAAYTVDQSLVNKKLLASPSVEWNHYRGGDVKFHDLKEDGIIDQGLYTVDDPGDLAIIGNSQARYNYSFGLNMSWCGVDFSAFFQGIGHQDWYPDKESYGFWGPLSRPYWSFLRKDASEMCWSEDNSDAYFPVLRGYMALDPEGTLMNVNDRYLQNIGYLRLKNLTLGYTFPDKWMQKIHIQHLRIYFSGDNLFYWSALKTPYIDPEQINASYNHDGNGYPLSRTFSFGIDITF